MSRRWKIVAVSVASLAVLGVAAAPTAFGSESDIAYISQGSHHWGVNCTQMAINNLIREAHDPNGPEPLEVDGVAGPKTDAGIRWFQGMLGLEQDGVVGPVTGAKVLEWLSIEHSGTRQNEYCEGMVPH